MLGTAAKIEVTKENCTIVGDGSSEEAVKSRVKQIKNLVANTEQDYEKEKLNERIARLSGGVAIIQVCSWLRLMSSMLAMRSGFTVQDLDGLD